jgi:hypothetical protein
VKKVAAGHYEQGFQWGTLKFQNNGPQAGAVLLNVLYADISLAAVRCFGTDDHGGSDETYLVTAAVSPADVFILSGDVSRTWRSPIKENTKAHSVIFVDTPIPTFQRIPVGTGGINVRIVVMDRESGGEDEVKQKIQSWADALAKDYKDGASQLPQMPAGAGTGSEEDVTSATMRKVEEWGKEKIAEALKDDLIGDKTFTLDPGWLSSLDGGEDASKVDMNNEIPAGVFVNFPRLQDAPFSGRWLYTNGDGTYKVYLHVKAHHEYREVPPGM